MTNTQKQSVYTVLVVAGAALSALQAQEPAWKWIGVAVAVVSALLGIFTTDSPSGTAAKLAKGGK